MYRMFNTLPSLAIACAAAISLAACNPSPNALELERAGGVATEAGPNGETLKAHPPTALAPTNDLRLDSRRPVMRPATSRASSTVAVHATSSS